MALFIRQQNERTELQERVAAELREKLKTEQNVTYEKPENTIISATHESQNLGPIVVLVVAVVFLGVAYLFLAG